MVAAGQRHPKHNQHRVCRPGEVHVHGVQCARQLQLHGDAACRLHQRRHGRVLHGGLSGHLHHHHGPERHTPLHDEQPPEEDGESHQRILPHRGRREAAEGLRDRQTDPHHHLSQDAGAGQGHAVQDHGVCAVHRGAGSQHPAAAAHHELPHLHGGDPGGGRGGGDEAHVPQTSAGGTPRGNGQGRLHRGEGRLHHPAGEGERARAGEGAQRIPRRRFRQLLRSRAAAAHRHPGVGPPAARHRRLLQHRSTATA